MAQNMTETEWIEKLKEEGWQDVSAVENSPNAVFEEHTHFDRTVHVILEGEFILIGTDKEIVMKPGEQFEIAPNTTHKAKCGPAGCRFIVGTKEE